MTRKAEPEQQALATVEPNLPAPATSTMFETFAALARDTSIPIDRLKQLMDLQDRVEKREAEKEYNAAFSRLQPRLPRITKEGKIDLGKGRPIAFARYEDIDAAVRPLLNSEGFSVSFSTDPVQPGDKVIVVTCTLSHSAGHSETKRTPPLPHDTGPGRNALQAVGSTLKYGQRYALCMALNIVTVGEDSDGAGIDFLDERQIDNIIDMFSACDMDAAAQSKFLTFMQAEAVREIHKRDYAKAMTALQAKLKKIQEATL